jgi:branched-chain amino acid aminotransferase
MINFNGSNYDSLGEVPENNLILFSGIPIHTEILMCSAVDILFWEDHYFMLMATLRRSRLNIPMNYTMEYFQEQINHLIRFSSQEVTTSLVSVQFYRRSSPSISQPITDVCFFIKAKPYVFQKHKITVELYKDYYINSGEYSNLYQTNFALRDLAKIFAYENQFGGCFLLNQEKNLAESTHGTIFLISEGTIKTPGLSSGVVNTVFRSKFIEQIKLERSFQLEETDISSFSLQKADEIFTLSLSSGFNIVRQFRKRVYESQRSNAFFDLINKQLKR